MLKFSMNKLIFLNCLLIQVFAIAQNDISMESEKFSANKNSALDASPTLEVINALTSDRVEYTLSPASSLGGSDVKSFMNCNPI